MNMRQLLRSRPTSGGWCVIPSSFSAELMGTYGFDWVCVDTQHGLIGYDHLVPMLQALSATATPTLVRVSWNHPNEIMKALDAGAHGVIVPMVNNREEARQAVDAVRFPPLGRRSYGPTRAAIRQPDWSTAGADDDVFLAVMIETREGLENIDEILSVPGVDGIYLGPNDLAVTHGLPPSSEGDAPEHRALIERAVEACRRHDAIAGIHCGSTTAARRWHSIGYHFCTITSDAAAMRAGAEQALDEMRTDDAAAARRSGGYA